MAGRRPCGLRLRFPAGAPPARGALGHPHARRRHRRAPRGNEGDTMSVTTIVLALIAVAVIAGAIWIYGRHRRLGQLETGAQATATRILEEARKEAEALRKE